MKPKSTLKLDKVSLSLEKFPISNWVKKLAGDSISNKRRKKNKVLKAEYFLSHK